MKPLRERTPRAWAGRALSAPDLLLLDHLQCEMKAATTALSLISKNPHLQGLVQPLLQVAQEELLHYGRIHEIVRRRGYRPEPITPSPYMAEMLSRASRGPHKPLLDRLLLAALVEARSCERFRLLAKESEDRELAALFAELVGPEAGHFNLYVDLAREFFPKKEAARRFSALSALESEALSGLEPGPALHSGWKGLACEEPRSAFSAAAISPAR